MALSTVLMSYLRRGQFPLTSSGDIAHWGELIRALESDPGATVAEVKAGMATWNRVDFDDRFSALIAAPNNVTVDTGQGDIDLFLAAAHARLCDDFGVASREPVQSLVQRLRVVMEGQGMPESSINLGLDPDLLMGNGLMGDLLTCLPDPAWGTDFGSVPDQDAIAIAAPAWALLKKRCYENQGVLTRYGAKPHYVLAHLLNHNLNGPGDEARNVVPFWATANTQMARQAEGVVKDFVMAGAQVQYYITTGPAVGMTPGRALARTQCTTAEQQELIDLEQHLPAYFAISCLAWDDNLQAWVDILQVTINNYVPETVPRMRG